MPLNNVADIVDRFTRNEVMTSNEVRQKMGLMPSKDPKADELINSNIRQPDYNNRQNQNVTEDQEEGGNIQNGTE